MNTSAAGFTIGAASKKAGVPIDTIRYYERESLLPTPMRRASGYRMYDQTAVDQLRFIRRAKNLGFSLDEIRDLLALSRDRARGVEGVKQRAEQRLSAIDERLAELTQVRKGLAQLIALCPGRGDLANCPILDALNHAEVQS
jgi:MerR family copper efflux transcriptional regulator